MNRKYHAFVPGYGWHFFIISESPEEAHRIVAETIWHDDALELGDREEQRIAIRNIQIEVWDQKPETMMLDSHG